MLTRVYIDNFRCFVNFEYRPARKQLILGLNGTGKSSLLDVLGLLRRVATRGDVEEFCNLGQRTRWLNQRDQVFELETALDGGRYTYRLVTEPYEPWGEPPRLRIQSETVHFDGKPIFEFQIGEVRLYNDRFEHKVTYEFDWHRPALATIMERKDNQTLSRFKRWLNTLYCFRINPFAMGAAAEGEDFHPSFDLANFASWYRHLVQADPNQNARLLDNLRACIEGFTVLRFEPAGENVRLLEAEFSGGAGKSRFSFRELSDGQRCLIGLYTVLHFLLAKGATVVFDEPDNFVSLRELQPWLMAVSDVIEQGSGQILVISHHPEFINQWAPRSGVQFVRVGLGPVHVEEFKGDPDSLLSPSELIARGWDRE